MKYPIIFLVLLMSFQSFADDGPRIKNRRPPGNANACELLAEKNSSDNYDITAIANQRGDLIERPQSQSDADFLLAAVSSNYCKLTTQTCTVDETYHPSTSACNSWRSWSVRIDGILLYSFTTDLYCEFNGFYSQGNEDQMDLKIARLKRYCRFLD